MEQADQPPIRDTKALIARARETCRQSEKLIAQAHELIEHPCGQPPWLAYGRPQGVPPRRPR